MHERRFADNPLSPPHGHYHVPALLRLLRPVQWVKNLLLFVPLLLAHQPDVASDLPGLAIAFSCFCLCASAGYIANDIHDVRSDRHHPVKRHRPLASGEVSAALAVAMAVSAVVISFTVASWLLPVRFVILLGAYLAFTILYSFWLKTRLLVDVLVLAGLYTLRLLAGGAAVALDLTPWLLAFSTFFFLSLAFAKRYAELAHAESDDAGHLKARNYRQEDMAVIQSVGPASGYLAVLVLAIYISSDLARQLYRHPMLLWLVCPLLLYWITRVWFLAHRRALSDDPVVFALRDPVSWITGILSVAAGLLAALLP